MKENRFLDGVSNIDLDIVERFIAVDNRLQDKADRPKNKKKTKGIWLRLGAAAACLAVIIGAVITFPMLNGGNPWFIQPPDVPIWGNAKFSADEIADLFGKYDSVSTNTYQKIYVPDAKCLYVDAISDEESIGVYRFKGNALNRNDFQAFVDRLLPKMAASVGIPTPQYEIKEYDYGDGIRARAEIDSYYMYISQNEERYWFLFSKDYGKLILDGETVEIDQRLADEEIINSIKSIKDKLFAIFDVSFTDAKIIRYFDSYSQHGAEFIDIYFYDKSAHPLNSSQDIPISDYICISFDNFENYDGDIVSDDVLTDVCIKYCKSRANITEEYALIENVKKISLEDAEALLYNGYVYGGHSCPLCMARQHKISFRGYDFVDIEYVFGRDEKTYAPTVGIPFYAFYKKIGRSRNGNSIYAKTYVAAIEVSGYEEYFKKQASEHQGGNAAVDYATSTISSCSN